MTDRCEMCGSEETLVQAVVEGSMLHVCKRCSNFGNVIEMKKPREKETSKRRIVITEPSYFVIESAGNIIKKKREERGLKQLELGKMVGEKESVIHKIESSNMVPHLPMAKKFEKILDIKLIEEYIEPEKTAQYNLAGKDLTIGDLIKIKKKHS